jgi:hypothetical protein
MKMKKSVVLACIAILGAGVFTGTVFSNNRTTDELGVAVSPQTLLLDVEQGGEVVVHTAIPLSVVNRASLELNGVPAVFTKADDRGNCVAYFNEDEIEATVAPPGAVMTFTGLTVDGEAFSGSDSVQVR